MLAASVVAFWFQSENAVASAKNKSTFAWLTPGLPLRSVSAPRQAMMLAMTALVASSPAASAGTMPSPLPVAAVWAKIWVGSAKSSIAMAVAFFLPRLASTCLAAARSCWPSGVASLMELSASDGEDLSRSSAFFNRRPVHWVAAISSGARMRPSLSVSMRSSDFGSNSMPRVGQARATQSFWSRLSSASKSAPVSSRTWSKPPAR